MVADFVIKTGDMIKITIPPPAVVPLLVPPIPLIGTSTSLMVNKMPACLLGDELPPTLKAPMPYTAPPFVTPGMGTVMVILQPTNMTKQTMNNKKPILIKGGPFQATFNVTAPAMQPMVPSPIPDPVLVKPGTAQFITTNATVKIG